MLEVHCAGDFQAAVPLFAREDQEQWMFSVTHAQAPLQVQVCAVLQCKVFFYFFSVRSYFQRSIIRGSPMDFKCIIQLQESPLGMVFSPPLSSQCFCILQFSHGCGLCASSCLPCCYLPLLLHFQPSRIIQWESSDQRGFVIHKHFRVMRGLSLEKPN